MSNERNRSNWSDWIEEGKKAPNFCLATHNRETLKLSSLRGAPVVLSFYPKDDTPGCTKEACGFRDAARQFARHQAVVLGVSGDSTLSHGKFRAKYDLPCTLLVDDDHAVAERYQPVEKVIPDHFPREKPPVFSSATHSRLPRAARTGSLSTACYAPGRGGKRRCLAKRRWGSCGAHL